MHLYFLSCLYHQRSIEHIVLLLFQFCFLLYIEELFKYTSEVVWWQHSHCHVHFIFRNCLGGWSCIWIAHNCSSFGCQLHLHLNVIYMSYYQLHYCLWYKAEQYEFMLHFGVIYQITEPLLQQRDYILLDVICSFTSSNVSKFHFYEYIFRCSEVHCKSNFLYKYT